MNESRLKHFPIQFFALIMGLAGLTIAWQRAEMFLDLSFNISNILLGFTVAVFLVIFITYIVKIFVYPQSVKGEIYHPIKLSFIPTISISFLLLGIATLDVAEGTSQVLWMIGTVLHILFTLYVMSMWFNQTHFKIEHMNPAWFIPLVGNILVPIAGVPHGYVEISWFYFSVGMIFWIVLLTMIFNRILFHHPVPGKLLPTYFIFIAPPAIGFLAYFNLAGHTVDTFGRFLYYSGLFFTLLMFTQLTRLAKIKFFISWWAYSFPLAAITICTLLMYHALGTGFFQVLSIVLLVALNVIILILLYRTAVCMSRRGICVEE